MKTTRLLRIALNVRDLRAACAFYVQNLDFRTQGAETATALFPGRSQVLRRGHQHLELTQPDSPGAPWPDDTCADDLWFQHCALATNDIAGLHARIAAVGVRSFSRNGPVTLPGGIAAWKFRDPDGHPLELIQFPEPDPATRNGIDHTAIAVADADRSIAFYRDLGLAEGHRQLNQGPEQDRLDGLDGAEADVVALLPSHPAPHLELLAYRRPARRAARTFGPADIPATRLVFEGTVPRAEALQDPDGHHLLLEPDRPIAP